MPRKNKKKSNAVGRAMIKNRFGGAKADPSNRDGEVFTTLIDEDSMRKRKVMQSVTDRNDLSEFIEQAELSDRDFTAEKESQVILVDKATYVHHHKRVLEEEAAYAEQLAKNPQWKSLAIPRRPPWNKDTTPEELDQLEKASFLEWRKKLVEMEETVGLQLTPFEKNIQIWRQLWRVVERSTLIVQVVDARDPLMFRCQDLVDYVRVTGKGKRSLLLVNKADLLTVYQRKVWAKFFVENNIGFLFFSARLENEKAEAGVVDSEDQADHDKPWKALTALQLLEKLRVLCPESNHPAAKVSKVIGMVGFPNVGKSSTINALLGVKKVGVTSTPGKTKHFQTLFIDKDLCLCDCPGLVFPSFVSNTAAMVCNGLLPIDQLREHVLPITLICQRIPKEVLCLKYGIELPEPPVHEAGRPPSAEELLHAHAVARGYMTGHGGPDQSRSSRIILKDYVKGELLYCIPPPGADKAKFTQNSRALKKKLKVNKARQEPSQRAGSSARSGKPPTKDDTSVRIDTGTGAILKQMYISPTDGPTTKGGNPTKRQARRVQKKARQVYADQELSNVAAHTTGGRKRGKEKGTFTRVSRGTAE